MFCSEFGKEIKDDSLSSVKVNTSEITAKNEGADKDIKEEQLSPPVAKPRRKWGWGWIILLVIYMYITSFIQGGKYNTLWANVFMTQSYLILLLIYFFIRRKLCRYYTDSKSSFIAGMVSFFLTGCIYIILCNLVY